MITIILNKAPYGTELAYNGLRLALALVKKGEQVRVFLIGDGVLCALGNQQSADGYYNIERMLKSLTQRGHEVIF